MAKTPIKVIIRTRPTVNFASKNIQMNDQTGQVSINIPKNEAQGHVNHQQENWGFQFDKILQNVSQEVVYDMCAKDIVNSFLDGYSGTIMCYGQTGAGKTFTVTGSSSDYKYRGMIPRVVNQVYQDIETRYDQQITVKISYLEIYNEMLTDLLASALQPEKEQNLAIQEDAKGNIYVKGLMQKVCSTEEEALSMLFEGETNRTITEHKLNKQSSRSHCVFTIQLEMRSRVESSEKVVISKLNLVDLAGSERTKKTGSEGQQLIEAAYINKSLSFLEQVVVALSEKSRDHIPYRQSKLTNMLKDSIGGNCKTILIANIWPEVAHLEESISTFKFASRMMKVSNDASVNIKLDPAILLKKYEREIKDLKQELAMHDTLANRGRISYEPYSPEQQYEQQRLAQSFLDEEIDDLEFESLRQVKELFFQFKNIYKAIKKDMHDYGGKPQKTSSEKGGIQSDQDHTQRSAKQGNAVGDEQNNYGFGLGKAPKTSKPQGQQLETLVNVVKDEPLEEATIDELKKSQQNFNQTKNDKLVNVDKNEVFQQFKETEGLHMNESILKNISDQKEKKK